MVVERRSTKSQGPVRGGCSGAVSAPSEFQIVGHRPTLQKADVAPDGSGKFLRRRSKMARLRRCKKSRQDFSNQPSVGAMVTVRKHLRWVANHKLKSTPT
jgi:hypothetical protein